MFILIFIFYKKNQEQSLMLEFILYSYISFIFASLYSFSCFRKMSVRLQHKTHLSKLSRLTILNDNNSNICRRHIYDWKYARSDSEVVHTAYMRRYMHCCCCLLACFNVQHGMYKANFTNSITRETSPDQSRIWFVFEIMLRTSSH